MLGLVCMDSSFFDVSFRFSVHPLANKRRTVLQDDAFTFGSDEKPNCIDVGQRHFVQVQRGWNATCGVLRTHVLDVFRLHTSDKANRGPVFADVGDDPQGHGRDRANAWRSCNGQSLPRSCAASDLQGEVAC